MLQPNQRVASKKASIFGPVVFVANATVFFRFCVSQFNDDNYKA